MAIDEGNKEPSDFDVYMFGDWKLNCLTNQLIQGDSIQPIEHRHATLLRLLITSNKKVLTRDDIMRTVWQRKVVNDESLAVAISQLRKLLNDDARSPRFIKTIPGVGYQFIAQSSVLQPVEHVLESALHARAWAHRSKVMWIAAILLIAVTAVGWAQWHQHSTITAVVPNTDKLTAATTLLNTGKAANLRQAIPIFRDILAGDPNNGKAWLGLAEAKMFLLGNKQIEADNYLELMTLLRKALAIDPNLARGHLWIARLVLWHDRNLGEAQTHFETAMKLGSNDELIQMHYTYFLMVQKRFNEARSQIGNLRNRDPLQFSQTQMAWVYLLEGNYHAAAAELDRIAATEGEDEDFHRAAQNVYLHLGDERRTFTHMQWFFNHAKLDPDKVAQLNHQFAMAGMKGVYQLLLDTKETADLGQFTPPLSWARYAVAVHQKDVAINYLKQAFDDHSLHTQCVAADPLYEPLYNDRRFRKLLAPDTSL